MKRLLLQNAILVLVFFVIFNINGCNKNESGKLEEIKKMEKEFTLYADSLDSKVRAVDTVTNLAYWNASIVSNPDNWKVYENAMVEVNKLLSNKDDFARLKKYKESGMIQDELVKRRLDVTYNMFLSKQLDTALLNQITKMEAAIENKYSQFRAEVKGKKLSDNEVEEVLKTSKDSKELEEVWLAHKQIGPVVEKDILALVNKRNEAAKKLGFNNYHEMSLKLSEQDPQEILKLFDELDNLTRGAFTNLKKEIDETLAKQYKIKPEDMMPWHYQNRYFQEAPKIYEVDLDPYYKDKDLVKITTDYYHGLGLEIEDMVKNSDLFEKPNKNQHAYCIDIDRVKQDVRVLCNVKPNNDWMSTLLHEYGHAVYEKYLDDQIPWVLKSPAHTFTTEAIAMIFGRFSKNSVWMQDMIGITKEESDKIAVTNAKILRLEQLVFSRWAQVMYRFEKSMYENPNQDLNKLWWDLVEKYQMIKRPAGRNNPDWATKIHIATSPCYYHNYLLGELLASQLYNHINTKILKNPEGTTVSFVGKKEVGKYLIDNVFMPGSRYLWNDMIEKATGEKLTPKYYAKQFVQ
jgi:peptidyl-dipeptidase A